MIHRGAPLLKTACIQLYSVHKGGPKNSYFRDRWQKKAWVTYRVRKHIRFLILFIPRSSNFKIFGNFNTQNLLWIYIIFHILSNQKIRQKKYKFQRHSILPALHKKISAHTHNVFFLFFVFCALLERRPGWLNN